MYTENYRYDWDICINQNFLQSNEFPSEDSACKWDMIVHEPSKNLSLRLKVAPKKMIICSYTLYVVCQQNSIQHPKITEGHFEFDNECEETYRLGNTIYFHNLIKKFKKFVYKLNEKNVNIAIDISVSFSKEQDFTTNSESSQNELSNNSLLNAILKDTQFCDVIIQTENIEFKAHKIVLSAASPVFKVILTSNMLERNTDCIKINDLKADAMQLMIDFIYERLIRIPNYHIAIELLKASDIYDIQNLKTLCSKYLVHQMNEGNVIEILITAKMRNVSGLTEAAMDFLTYRPKIYQPEDFERILRFSPKFLLTILANVFRAYTECKSEVA